MTGSSLLLQGDATRIPLADQSVDLVFGSPPYCDARTYGIDAQRDCDSWVKWMLQVTAEAVRVCRGLVLWVCAGVTRKHCYWPACEGLLWEWWKRGGQCWRPAYWHRVGIPGSGGKRWLRSDIEYVLCFKGAGVDFWADNTAMGHPPKWSPGGKMTNRTKNGKRCYERNWKLNQVNHPRQHYTEPEKANPGNLIKGISVGGGKLGNACAHENEAPFPERLAEFFIRSFCPPGGVVLDPFSGSATTVSMAVRLGRHGVGMDLRRSQCELGARRVAEDLLLAERPHAPRKKRSARKDSDRTPPLFGAFK